MTVANVPTWRGLAYARSEDDQYTRQATHLLVLSHFFLNFMIKRRVSVIFTLEILCAFHLSAISFRSVHSNHVLQTSIGPAHIKITLQYV